MNKNRIKMETLRTTFFLLSFNHFVYSLIFALVQLICNTWDNIAITITEKTKSDALVFSNHWYKLMFANGSLLKNSKKNIILPLT